MGNATEYANVKFTTEQVTSALDFIQENRGLSMNERLILQRAVELLENAYANECLLSSMKYDGKQFSEPTK